jgi:small-conductance mechanosensitive channel
MVFAAFLTNRLLAPEVLAFRPVATGTILALQVGSILSFAWLLLQAGRGMRRFLDEHFDISQPDNLRARRVRTQIAFIERIFDVAVVVVTVAIVIGQFESGRKLSNGLLASAGVASLVIGLAAQRTLANLLAGFQIAFTSPIHIDDAVVVENEWGWIEEISLTYVVVRVWDRRRLILPITYFVEKPFQNWTRKSGQILGSVFLEVAHHTPFQPLDEELNRLLDEHPKWDGDARVLQVVEMKERSIQMRALMTARNSPDCWDLRCDVRRGLIEFLVREYPDCLPAARLSVVDGRSSSSELSGPPTKRRPLDTWIDDLHPEHRAHDSSPQAG